MPSGTLFSKKTEGSLRARSRFTIQLITSLSTSVLISNFELQINTRLTGRNGNVFGLERQVLRRGNNRHLLVPHGRAFTCLSCPMTFHSGERWANAWYAGDGRVAPCQLITSCKGATQSLPAYKANAQARKWRNRWELGSCLCLLFTIEPSVPSISHHFPLRSPLTHSLTPRISYF